MKDDVKVPGVAWWILAGMVIPVLQAWLVQAFPDSPFLWVPAVVGVLGAVGKWIEWLLRRNSGAESVAGAETGKDTPGIAPAALSAPEQAQTGNGRRGLAWWLLG